MIPQTTCDFGMKKKEMLSNVALKNKQKLNNVVDFRMTEIENIKSPIKKSNNKMLSELIINIETDSGEKVFYLLRSRGREIMCCGKTQTQRRGSCTCISFTYLANQAMQKRSGVKILTLLHKN